MSHLDEEIAAIKARQDAERRAYNKARTGSKRKLSGNVTIRRRSSNVNKDVGAWMDEVSESLENSLGLTHKEVESIATGVANTTVKAATNNTVEGSFIYSDKIPGAPVWNVTTGGGDGVSNLETVILLDWTGYTDPVINHTRIYASTSNVFDEASYHGSVRGSVYAYPVDFSASPSEDQVPIYFWLKFITHVGNESLLSTRAVGVNDSSDGTDTIAANVILANHLIANKVTTNLAVADQLQSRNWPTTGFQLDLLNGIWIKDHQGNTILRTIGSASTDYNSRIDNASQQWVDITGTGTPESNATVGATWGSNINGQPAGLADLDAVAAADLDKKAIIYHQNSDPNNPPTGPIIATEGDMWVKTNDPNRAAVIWDGSAWQPSEAAAAIDKAQQALDLANSQAITYFQDDDPTSVAGGSLTMRTGDMWIDTNDSNIGRIWNGTSWDLSDAAGALAAANAAQLTANSRSSIYFQEFDPTTANGGSLTMTIGDMWIASTTIDTPGFVWSGAGGWVSTEATIALSEARVAQATADAKTVIYYQDEDPNTPAGGNVVLYNGDMWVDTNDSNKSRIWSSAGAGSWSLSDGAAALSTAITAQQTANNAQGTADNKAVIYYVPSDPNNPPNGPVVADGGDLWVDTSDGNKTRFWDGVNSWVDSDAAAAYLAAQAATTLATSKSIIFYQPEDPTSAAGGSNTASSGDMWIDTDDPNNRGRVWNDSTQQWDDSEATAALIEAGVARGIADNKAYIYFQSGDPNSPPNGPIVADIGDMWVDTNDSNKSYLWDGSAWVESDGAAAFVAATNALNSVDSKATVYYQNAKPLSGTNGDLWYDTSPVDQGGGRLYRFGVDDFDEQIMGQMGSIDQITNINSNTYIDKLAVKTLQLDDQTVFIAHLAKVESTTLEEIVRFYGDFAPKPVGEGVTISPGSHMKIYTSHLGDWLETRSGYRITLTPGDRLNGDSLSVPDPAGGFLDVSDVVVARVLDSFPIDFTDAQPTTSVVTNSIFNLQARERLNTYAQRGFPQYAYWWWFEFRKTTTVIDPITQDEVITREILFSWNPTYANAGSSPPSAWRTRSRSDSWDTAAPGSGEHKYEIVGLMYVDVEATQNNYPTDSGEDPTYNYFVGGEVGFRISDYYMLYMGGKK